MNNNLTSHQDSTNATNGFSFQKTGTAVFPSTTIPYGPEPASTSELELIDIRLSSVVAEMIKNINTLEKIIGKLIGHSPTDLVGIERLPTQSGLINSINGSIDTSATATKQMQELLTKLNSII
jgi:hypothetical protein